VINVTIRIPAYNESATIIELLESVSRQKVDGFKLEILVIDDGSTDGTRDLLDARPKLYTKLIKRPQNGGKGAAVLNFELHDGDLPIIIDPGRGSYADPQYEVAAMHNGVTIDGRSPTPVNRPYYATAFRDRIFASPPEMQRTRDGRVLRNAGFGYLKGVTTAEREWRFLEAGVKISDHIVGRGRHGICRRFCTPLTVTREADAVIMSAGLRSYRLLPGADFRLEDITCWSAYGEGRPATQIISECRGSFPFDAVVSIERI
jgi:hypothetical protein